MKLVRRFFVVSLTVAAVGGAAAPARAVPPLVEGKTSAVYDYAQAIRERVFIPQPGIDQDRNGAMDWITADIIRPNTSENVPAIISPSTYFTAASAPSFTGCLGRERECMAEWDGDGVNDRWPLFYDNYFVPRGYAYVLGQANGTGYTEHGCTLLGGPGDVAGERSIVDWLNGRVAGYSAASVTAAPKLATWHNGSSAMIASGPDGGLAYGVATTGVDGLKAVVGMNAMSNLHENFQTGGVPWLPNFIGNFVPLNLTNGPTPPPGVNLPNRRDICLPVRQDLINPANVEFGPAHTHGDVNPWWRDRDSTLNASKVKAAVFVGHGIKNEIVDMFQVLPWWNGLTAAPRKMWLSRSGPDDLFDVHRAKWVDAVHRWFDHWLYGVPNGIMNEAPVSIEDERGAWEDYPTFPVPGAHNVDLYLRASADPAAAGTIAAVAGGGSRDTLTFTTAVGEADVEYIQDPTGAQTIRRVFLSRPLTKDVVISGQPTVDMSASLGAPRTTLGFLVADVGADLRFFLAPNPTLTTRSCWGASSAGAACATPGSACTAPAQTVEHACYLDTDRQSRVQSLYRIGRGALDPWNRNSLWWQDASPTVPGQQYRFRFPTEPVHYVLKAGHQLALIAHGPDRDFINATGATALPVNVPVTLDTRTSKVTLPVVGGYEALAAAGAFTDPTASVGGTVPATLSLTLGTPASFGAFTPGVSRTYQASMTANVISSAGDAALTVTDPSSHATGRLVNGAFSLPQPLQGLGTVKTYSGPVSNDAATITFTQPIAATDALRTGAYSKTLTFTLSTSAP